MKNINDKILILKNKEEANKVYDYLSQIVERASAFCKSDEEINKHIPYINITYNTSENRFILSYNTQYFRAVEYGCYVTFYKPDWADMDICFRNVKLYTSEYDGTRKRMYGKKVINELTHFVLHKLEGNFKFVKEKKGINSLYFDTLVLDTIEKCEELEDVFDYFCGGNLLHFKVPCDTDIYWSRGNDEFGSLFRLLQENEMIKFKVKVDTHILLLLRMLRESYAFTVVCSYNTWVRGIIEINLDTNMKGTQRQIENMTFDRDKVIYEGPKRLSFNGALQMIKNSLHGEYKITNVDTKKRKVMLVNRFGVPFELSCNCLN